MLFSLVLAFAVGPDWYESSNHPGWEAFGAPVGNRLDHPQRWRRTSDRSIEYILDGDPIPDGHVKVQEPAQAVPEAIIKPARPGGDPYGFVGWLNATRASYGLAGVAWSDEMVQSAARNNQHQLIRGIGHYDMRGATRQNAAMMSYPALLSAWMNSPGHRAALLDPTIVHVGIAFSGAYCTFSAR